MIKEMTVAQCDLCGSIVPAEYEYCQREDESWYTHPKDWHVSPANSQMLFCPKCWARIGEPDDRTDRT